MCVSEFVVADDLDRGEAISEFTSEHGKEFVTPKQVIPQEGNTFPVKIDESFCGLASLDSPRRRRPDHIGGWFNEGSVLTTGKFLPVRGFGLMATIIYSRGKWVAPTSTSE